MRGDDLVTGQIRVTQLYLDTIAQRREHVGEHQHFFPLRVVAFDRRRLALRHKHVNTANTAATYTYRHGARAHLNVISASFVTAEHFTDIR